MRDCGEYIFIEVVSSSEYCGPCSMAFALDHMPHRLDGDAIWTFEGQQGEVSFWAYVRFTALRSDVRGILKQTVYNLIRDRMR